MLGYIGSRKLPLCRTNFDKEDGWKAYFPLLWMMLRDLDGAEKRQAADGPPLSRPPFKWACREVTAILESSQQHEEENEEKENEKACAGSKKPRAGAGAKKNRGVQWNMVTKIASALVYAIENRRRLLRKRNKTVASLTDEQFAQLDAIREKTIASIEGNSFRPQMHLQRRGAHRQFDILPQHGYTTRFLPINTEVLLELHKIVWDSHGHPEGDRLKTKGEQDADFRERQGYWWSTVFRLEKLQGMRVPGMDMPHRTTAREFSFYMETDGFSCSFICWRPKCGEAGKELTPMDVEMDANTLFRAADPGLNDMLKAITPEYDENGAITDGDRGSETTIPNKWWHHLAGHILARKLRKKLRLRAKARGDDIGKLEGEMPSGKTSRPDEYLKHAVAAALVFPKLYKYFPISS